jgi:hypothetical protein
LLESAKLANSIASFDSNGRSKLGKIEGSLQSEIGSAILVDNACFRLNTTLQIQVLVVCVVKLALEEVEGMCPQSMSGIRVERILCMDRPRERLSSDAWRPMAIRDESKQYKVKV